MAPTEKWGTITKCRFQLGHQRLTNFELQQSVEKLTRQQPKQVRQWWAESYKHKKTDEDTILTTVTRLTKNANENVTDSKRISVGRIKKMGVVNSFAWKGYN